MPLNKCCSRWGFFSCLGCLVSCRDFNCFHLRNLYHHRLLVFSELPSHPFNGPMSRTTRVSRYQKVKPIWILLKQETVSGSDISWAICKSAPRSRQITTPVSHRSVFYRPDALPAAQPTASKHWRLKNCHHGIKTETGFPVLVGFYLIWIFIDTACIVCRTRSMKWYSVRLSVCPSMGQQQQQICCCGPGGQEISISCCSSDVQRVNVYSATFSAFIGSWTQTCYILFLLSFIMLLEWRWRGVQVAAFTGAPADVV